MLSTTYDFLRRKNPYVDVRLFGQEINPESYAICLTDMLIKGQDVKNIMGDEEANTLKTDCFPEMCIRDSIHTENLRTTLCRMAAPCRQWELSAGRFRFCWQRPM